MASVEAGYYDLGNTSNNSLKLDASAIDCRRGAGVTAWPDIRVPHAKGRLSSIFMVLIMCSLILNLSSLVSVPRDTERL